MHFDDDNDEPVCGPLARHHMAGMSEATADAVRAEMDRRAAAGLPATPEMHWED
ncbi:hypothetical protein [Streptomyces sp. NPDC007100]|uniref:hypothetical protein n=1 Tax=Streptomyces sp. NPDC007100 TaxID=3155602 RepID=UPI0033E7A909